MIGSWKGYYKFDNEKIQNIIGFEKTNFTIAIESYNGVNFYGKVNDDVSTGGMKETGDIVGKVSNKQILFKKLMPKSCVIVNSNGDREISDKKHSTLYYVGTFSDDKKEVNGEWFFKRKIGFLYGIIPILFRPGKGTWNMKLS